MERVAPGITAWLDEIAEDAGGELDIRFAFLRDQLLAHASVLQEIAIERVGSDALDPAALEIGANEAAELLSRLILPVGLDDSLDGRAHPDGRLAAGVQQAW